MDNEKNDLINDNQNQKLNDDVKAKIADAAAEIQDEIDSANETQGDVEETVTADDSLENSFTDITAGNVDETANVRAEGKKGINLSVGALVGIIAGCVVVAALIVVLSMNFFGAGKSKSLLGAKPEGKVVATVDDQKITTEDLKFYIYSEAMTQYLKIEGQNATGDFEGYDWDKDVDGKKLSDLIKENALKNAISDAVTITQGEKILSEEDAWKDTDSQQIESNVNSYISQYGGEEGFKLRTRTMGISSAKQYARTYLNVIRTQGVQAAIEADPSYLPTDVDYSKYLQDDRASVKHILIEATDPAEVQDPTVTPDPAAMDPAAAEATAKTVYDLAKSGTDFNQLMEQYNQDTGEPTEGYTFISGRMVEEFETAAFALKLDEISEPVKTDYGFHIIKRIPGLYELQGYWKEQAKISEKSGNFDSVSVKAVMDDIQAASAEIEAEEASAPASANAVPAGN